MRKTENVTGHFQRGWVDGQGAHTEVFLKGADPQEVEAMLKYAHPDKWFPTATMRNRKVTPAGQEGDENPLGRVTGHADLMHSKIRNIRGDGDGYDVGGSFTGFIRGGAPVDIDRVPGGTLVRETGTRATPDFTKIPVAGAMQKAFEDHVPIAGAVARGMRRIGEEVLGKVFEGVHVMAASTVADDMANTINQKRKTGKW